MNGIVLLQETHSVPGDQTRWECEWQGKMYMSSGTNYSRGVTILLPNKMESTIYECKPDEYGRYIMLKGVFDGQKLTIMNLYAPTADKSVEQAEFLDEIVPILEENSVDLIIGGDLNTYLEEIDKYGNNVIITKFATRLKNVMHELGLLDIWRVTNPECKWYTWRKTGTKTGTSGIQQSRLDYFIISENLIYQITKCNIQYALYSDHNPVRIQLESLSEVKRGRGFWKLNVSLLNDKEYVNKINELLDYEIEKYKNLSNKGLKWDTIKMMVRGFSIVSIRASKVSHGVILSASSPALSKKVFIVDVVRLKTEILKPFSAMFNASMAPIVPSPIRPIFDLVTFIHSSRFDIPRYVQSSSPRRHCFLATVKRIIREAYVQF